MDREPPTPPGRWRELGLDLNSFVQCSLYFCAPGVPSHHFDSQITPGVYLILPRASNGRLRKQPSGEEKHLMCTAGIRVREVTPKLCSERGGHFEKPISAHELLLICSFNQLPGTDLRCQRPGQ